MQKKYQFLELLCQISRHLHIYSVPSSPDRINDPEKVSSLIRDMLTADRPCMVARLGSGELEVVTSYLGQQQY